MKIQVKVSFPNHVAKTLPRGETETEVWIDEDYTEDNESSVYSNTENELYEKYGRSFNYDEFKVENLYNILEDIKYEEFKEKTLMP